MADAATVDIIVPVFNSLHVVRPCIESVLRHSSDYRLLIVDDGSDSHTAAVLDGYADAHDHLEIIHQPQNLGFVHACNRGFAEVRGDLVVLLNSDTEVTPRWLDKIRRCFAHDPTVGVASPVSNFAPHMRLDMLPGLDPLQMNTLVETLSPRSYPDITTPEGFCYAIRTTCLQAIGGFDPLFDRGYGEESDLAMRANYHGWRTVCVDDTFVYHQGRGTFGQEVRDQLYAANKGVFHDRWGERYRAEYPEFVERDVLGTLRERLDEQTPSEYLPGFRR